MTQNGRSLIPDKRMLSRLLKSAAQHYRLQRKFQILNLVVVLAGVAAAAALWVSWIKWLRLALGLPLGSVPMDGLLFQFLVWVSLTLVSVVALFYVGVLLAASVAMLPLILTRSVSMQEAIDYVVQSKYPENWYR
jgi:hypothetical protein